MTEARVLEAMEERHRSDLGQMAMQLARYRMALEDNGIEPPDMQEAELLQMWRDCAAVVETASEVVAKLGTAKELLADSWFGKPR